MEGGAHEEVMKPTGEFLSELHARDGTTASASRYACLKWARHDNVDSVNLPLILAQNLPQRRVLSSRDIFVPGEGRRRRRCVAKEGVLINYRL